MGERDVGRTKIKDWDKKGKKEKGNDDRVQ